MPARLIAHLPDGPALSFWLEEGQSYDLGRGKACALRIDHPSVSRRHFQLNVADSGTELLDLGSKNGIRVDGLQTANTKLEGTHWLELGDVLCRLEHCDRATALNAQSRRQSRVEQSRTLRQRVAAAAPSEVLQRCLEAVVQLTECDRGWLLMPTPTDWTARHGCTLTGDADSNPNFVGSRTALDRALTTTRPVVVNDIGQDPTLNAKASVSNQGLRSLLVLPLLHQQRPLALIYADRKDHPQPITEFDLSLLDAFVERATVWLVAQHGLAAVDALPGRGDGEGPTDSAAA